MGVGIILVERDRFFETFDRIVLPVQRLQRAAAIVPRAHVFWRLRQRAVEGGQRFGLAAELEQRRSAIVKSFDMVRRLRKHGVEIAERLRVAAHGREDGAAIETCVAMRRGSRASTASKHASASCGRLSALKALAR